MAYIAGCSPPPKLYLMWIWVWAQKLDSVICETGQGNFCILIKMFTPFAFQERIPIYTIAKGV